MKKILVLSCLLLISQPGIKAFASKIEVGNKLPEIEVKTRGIMVPEYEIQDNKMVFVKDGGIEYKPWSSHELKGRVATIYHLAARNGIEDINKQYIDALIKAKLPEKLPQSKYKTTTILNTNDALWGTAGIAAGKFEKSQKKYAYAFHVSDKEGVAQRIWGLEKKNSAVIVLDKEGNILFFKEGKLSNEEIDKAVSLIKKELEN